MPEPVTPRAIIDAQPVAYEIASLSLADAGVAHGDGALETIGVWDGRPFRLSAHLLRLDASLAALCLPPAPIADLTAQVADILQDVEGDAALRIYLTASGTTVLTLMPPPDRGDLRVLVPQPAPWVQPPAGYAPAGAKSMSYAPNMTARRRAQAAGGDDALLVSVPEGHILEGPTFGVLIVVDGVIHIPTTELGIVDSISRRTLVESAVELGIPVREDRWPLALLDGASELIVSSALRPATPIAEVRGTWTAPPDHPVADALAARLETRRRNPAP